MIDRAPNVIVRNLSFIDAADCFPRLGPDRRRRRQLELASTTWSRCAGATNVWIDHNTFSDGDNPDAAQPVYFGRPYQVHDGALRHHPQLATWSRCRRTSLQPRQDDADRLDRHRRAGRRQAAGHPAPQPSSTTWASGRRGCGSARSTSTTTTSRSTDGATTTASGVGIQSAVYVENNYFLLQRRHPARPVLKDWKGTASPRTAPGPGVNGDAQPVSLLAAYNASHDPDFGADAGWTPALRAVRPTARGGRAAAHHVPRGRRKAPA